MELDRDFKEFVELLNDNEVEFQKFNSLALCIGIMLFTISYSSKAQSYIPDDFIQTNNLQVESNLEEFRIIPIDSSNLGVFEFYRNRVNFKNLRIPSYSINYRTSIPFDNTRNYKTLLGHLVDESRYDFYFINRNKTILSVFSFDIISRDFKEKVLANFDRTSNLFLASNCFNDGLVLLSIEKKSSTLNVLKMTGYDEIIEFNYALKNEFGNNNFSQLYFRLVDLSANFKDQARIAQIDAKMLDNLALTQSTRKVYIDRGSIIITLDDDPSKTTLINLNLINNNFFVREFDKGQLENCSTNTFYSANSLVLDRFLYQVITCRKELKIKITDLHSNELMAVYNLEKDSVNQDFRYATFKEEIGSTLYTGPKDIYTSTSKVLRKGINYNIAIGLKKTSDEILRLDVGTFQQKESSFGAIIPTPSPFWVYMYVYKEYPYSIFVRNYLNINTFKFERVEESSQYTQPDDYPQFGKHESKFILNELRYFAEYSTKEKRILLHQIKMP